MKHLPLVAASIAVLMGLAPPAAAQTRVVSLFADVHMDRYFADGVDTPIVPVRVGLMMP